MSARHCTDGPEQKKIKIGCAITHDMVNIDEDINSGEPSTNIPPGLLQTDSGHQMINYVR